MLCYGLGYKSGCYVIGLGGGVILGSYINVTPTVVGIFYHSQGSLMHNNNRFINECFFHFCVPRTVRLLLAENSEVMF